MAGFSEQVNQELGLQAGRVPPAIQAGRDDKRLAILQNELKNETNPDNIRSIQTEIAAATGGKSAPKADQSIGAQVNDVLLGGKTARDAFPDANTAPPAAASSGRYTNDPNPPEPAKSADREIVRAVASGIGHSVKGGLVGLWALAKTGGDFDAAAQAVRDEQAKAYQAKGETAQKGVELLGSNYNPLNWIPHAAKAVAEKGAEAGLLQPWAATALETAGAAVNPGAVLGLAGKVPRPARVPQVENARTEFGSVGAAAAANKATAANASPEIQAIVAKSEKVHPEALKRQVEAESLPIPIKLTEGQATGDVSKISREFNLKGKHEDIAKRYAEQGDLLHKNLDTIRDEVAPNVYGADHVQNGRAIIDAYREHDATLRGAISEKYKALENANGGNFPIDGVAFVDAAEAALKKSLKTAYVPKEIAAEMQRFKNGEPMNFEQFEALRTNLASDMRRAERAGDGNAEAAASIVRGALENLPLTADAAALKPIADIARSAAKARFDLIKKDPAYKAVVSDKVAPDDFIQKFVINGKVDNVKTMIENLQPNSVAHETMAAGVLNHLKKNAGADFNQKSFNNGLSQLTPDGKLVAIVGGQAANTLETLGRVADYTQRLPRGHSANTSHTLVGALAEHGKNAVELAVNAKLPMGGTLARGYLAKRAEAKEVNSILQTGAGINLKDVR